MSAPTKPIAYLISQYPAVSHTFIQREIETLVQSGFQIHVASINQADPTSKDSAQNVFYVKAAGFLKAAVALLFSLLLHPIHFIRALATVFQLAGADLKRILYHFFYLGEAALIAQWMDKVGAKHLHVHFGNPASTVALLVSKLRPYTFSITIHGPDEFYDVTNNSLAKKFYDAKFLCCIGYYARSQILRLLPQTEWAKIEITPMGVDPEQYTSSNRQTDNSPLIITCVGRLHANKGQFVLLDALSKILEKGISFNLHLVGDGMDKKALMKRVDELKLNESVSFEGSLKPEAVKQILSKTDVFVLPSFAEGIPVSLMEAMSMEIPCISTVINGIPELIHHGSNGLLVYPSDVKGLTNSIRDLCLDKNLRRQLGTNARKTILEKCVLSTNVKKIAEVFRKYEG